MDTAPSKFKVVYVITERNGRSYWNKVGVAFTNRDGSLAVRLDAMPINGELHIRDYVPKDDSPEPSHGLRMVGSNNLAHSA